MSHTKDDARASSAASRADDASSSEEPPSRRARRELATVVIVHNRGLDDEEDARVGDIARMKEAEDEVVDVARHVAHVLESRGVCAERLEVDADLSPLVDRVAQGDVSLVFNLVESLGGDAAREPEVPTLLARLGVSFTGNSAPALRRALEKDRVRAALAEHHVAVSPAVVVTRARRLPPSDALPLTYPLFVKPARVDGSIGIDQGSVVGDYDALKARVDHLQRAFGGAVLVEEYLPGPEINVAVCPDARGGIFAPTMLDFSGFKDGQWPVVTYAAKWVEGSDDYNCRSVPLTNQLPREIVDEAIKTARAALDAIGADGYARVDMRLDRAGRPIVIDVNPNPALHPEAGFALALGTVGIDFATLVMSIVDHGITREVKRAPTRPAERRSRAPRGAPVESR